MGKYYQAAEPKFIDFIYQPNYELELAKNQAALEVDLADKQLVDATSSFRAYQGFQGMANKYNEQLNEAKLSADKSISDFIANKDNNSLANLKQTFGALGNMYVTGDIAKSEANYREIISKGTASLKNIQKYKDNDPVKASNDEFYTNHWMQTKIAEGNAGKDVDMVVDAPTNYFGAQEYLKETIDTDSLKVVLSSPGAETNSYINEKGKAVTIPPTWIREPLSGVVYDPKRPESRYNTVKKYLEYSGVGFDYNQYQTDKEGYLTDLIRQIGYTSLDNIGYRKMVQYDYEKLGMRGGTVNEKGEFVEDPKQSFEDYLKQRKEVEATNFANKHEGYTNKVTSTVLKDDRAEIAFRTQQNIKEHEAKKKIDEQKDELITAITKTTPIMSPAQAKTAAERLTYLHGLTSEQRGKQGVQAEYLALLKTLNEDNTVSSKALLEKLGVNTENIKTPQEAAKEADLYKDLAGKVRAGEATFDVNFLKYERQNAGEDGQQTYANLEKMANANKLPKSLMYLFDSKNVNGKTVYTVSKDYAKRERFMNQVNSIDNTVKSYNTNLINNLTEKAQGMQNQQGVITLSSGTKAMKYTSDFVQDLSEGELDYVDPNLPILSYDGKMNLVAPNGNSVEKLIAMNLIGVDGKKLTNLEDMQKAGYIVVDINAEKGGRMKFTVKPTEKLQNISKVPVSTFAFSPKPESFTSNYLPLMYKEYGDQSNPNYNKTAANSLQAMVPQNYQIQNDIQSAQRSFSKGKTSVTYVYPYGEGISYTINKKDKGGFSVSFKNTSNKTISTRDENGTLHSLKPGQTYEGVDVNTEDELLDELQLINTFGNVK